MAIQFFSGLFDFSVYFATALLLVGSFAVSYAKLTPYDEFGAIKAGNCAASVSVVGAVLGFLLPLASVIAHSISVLDMLLWSGVAATVQLCWILILVRRTPWVFTEVQQGNLAVGILLGASSMLLGLANAACLVY